MADRNNTIEFGRVIYVEPNNYINGTGKGTNFTFEPEDYSILVDLQVDVVDRYAYYGSGTKEEIQYTLEWDAKGTKTSMFRGTNGLLTTKVLDTSFEDVMNNVNQETIGINSIDIKYNSWNYPEITIQFTDVRGASLMSSSDYLHSPLTGNAYKDKYATNFANSFFSTFFRFPYPRYTLIVKGFYGRPVSYTLCVNDFKTKFNPGTGNFDVTVSFIGYMYGLLTDIPMRLLFAAPYSEYVGKKYWAEMTDMNKSFKFHYADTQTPMYTFFELNENLKQINQKLKEMPRIVELMKKETELVARKNGVEEVLGTYNSFVDQFGSSGATASDVYDVSWSSSTDEGLVTGSITESRRYLVIYHAAGTTQEQPEICEECGGDGKKGVFGTECKNCHGTGKVSKTGKRTNLNEELPGTTNKQKELWKKIYDFNAVPENADCKIVFIKRLDTEENASKKLVGSVFYDMGTNDGGKTNLTFQPKDGTDFTNESVFSDVLAADREKVLGYLKGSGFAIAKEIHEKTKTPCVAVTILRIDEFEDSVNINLTGIDSKIQQASEDVKHEQEATYTLLLGFKVSLKNIIDMCLAHLDTLMHCMYYCMDEIKRKNRRMMTAGLEIPETDVMATTEEQLFLPPFFAFRKKNPRTDEYEDQWLEKDPRFSNRELFQEIQLIDGLLNGSLKAEADAAEKAADIIGNNAVKEYGPTIGVDYKPSFVTDYLNKKNPYSNAYAYSNASDNYESIIALFAFRCMLASIYCVDYPDIGTRFDRSNNNDKKAFFKKFAENDAENFALTKAFEKFRTSDEADFLKNTEWEDFEKYITGNPSKTICDGKNSQMYRVGNMKNPPFTKNGNDYEISYGGKDSRNVTKCVVPLNYDSASEAATVGNSIFRKSLDTGQDPERRGLGISRDYAMPFVSVSDNDNKIDNSKSQIIASFDGFEASMPNIGWYFRDETVWKEYFSGSPRGKDRYWFPTIVKTDDLLKDKNRKAADASKITKKTNTRGNLYDGTNGVYAVEPPAKLTSMKDFFLADDDVSNFWNGTTEGRTQIDADTALDTYVEKEVVPVLVNDRSGRSVTVYGLPCGEGTLFENEFYAMQNTGGTVTFDNRTYNNSELIKLRKAFLFLHSLPTAEYGALGHVVSSIIKRTYMPSVSDIPLASALFIGGLYFRDMAFTGNFDNFIIYNGGRCEYLPARKREMLTYSNYKGMKGDEIRRPLHPITMGENLLYQPVVNTAIEEKINELEKNRKDDTLRKYLDGEKKADAYFCGFWDVPTDVKLQFIRLFTNWALSEFPKIDDQLSLKTSRGKNFTPGQIEYFKRVISKGIFKDGKAKSNDEKIQTGKSYNDFIKDSLFSTVYKNHERLGASNEGNSLFAMLKYDCDAVQMINRLLESSATVEVAFPRVMMTRDMFSPTWDKEREALQTDGDSLKTAWETFKSHILEKVEEEKKQDESDEAEVQNVPPASVTPETKLSLYETLKNLHDKWLVATHRNKYEFCADKTVVMDGIERQAGIADNFFYINSFHEQVGDEIMLNIEELPKQIQTVIDSSQEAVSLYSFMYDVADQARVQLLALPVFNDMANPQYVRQMFTPIPYDELNFNEINTETQYVFMYPEEASKQVSIPNCSDDADERYKFPDDSFILVTESGQENRTNVPVTFSKTTEPNVPVIGVTFAKQNQSFFKNISVSMDNPKTTEVAIENTFMIANRYNGGNTQVTALGQDLFSIYSNYSYECTVEMMGCACIMPLMYFQLNNIPMFRGTYIIYNVNHSITPGNMTTTFTGQRLSRFRKKRNENAMSCSPNEDGINRGSTYNSYDTNGNPIYTTGSGYKPLNDDDYKRIAKSTGVEKNALRAVEYAETHYTGGYFSDGKLKVYYDPWVAKVNHVTGDGLIVASQTDTTYAFPQDYRTNIDKVEAAKEALNGSESASGFTIVGAFGIPGQCYSSCGVNRIETFYSNCQDSFGHQATYFAALLNSKPDLKKALHDKDWKKFAKLYKGAGGATTTGVFCPGDDINFTNYANDLEAGYNDAESYDKRTSSDYQVSQGQEMHLGAGYNPHAEQSKAYAEKYPLHVRAAVEKLISNCTKVHYSGHDGCNKINTTGLRPNGKPYTHRGVDLRDTEEHKKNPGTKPSGFSLGLCATYVKCALESGGYPYFSCDGGACADLFEQKGFEEIYRSGPNETWENLNGKWQNGDVMTICKIDGVTNYGHVAMWSGTNWISDFKQNSCQIYGRYPDKAKEAWNNGCYRFFRYRNRIDT